MCWGMTIKIVGEYPGSQFGCVYIDEINTANIDFVREISTRNDYMMATLNPDDPNLSVYKEFINRSRPYKKYKGDVPHEIMAELKEKPVPRWRYWFFHFKQPKSTPEMIEKKINLHRQVQSCTRIKSRGLGAKQQAWYSRISIARSTLYLLPG